jgi:EAL domain-containing protein (putative c-di-GMP-specific phosphodiesterase class I)
MTGRDGGEAIDPVPAMRRVVEQALVLIPTGDGAAIQLVTGDGFTYACGSGTSADRVGTRLPRRDGIPGLAAQQLATVCSEDATRDHRALRSLRRRLGTVSVLCAPLAHGSEVFGTLEVSSRQRAAFTAEDVSALSRLSRIVATMLGGVFALSRAACPATARADEDDPELRSGASAPRPRQAVDHAAVRRVERAIDTGAFEVHGQPICDLRTGQTAAIEALTRFCDPSSPEVWFAQARRAARGVELELAAARRALELHDDLGCAVPLAVNVSAETIAAPELRSVLDTVEPDQIILELTEHLPVQDYPGARRALHHIRDSGIRLAVDDTGAGFSSLQHIINLAPDIIKLDRQITHTIEADPGRQYLTETLVNFARRTAATVIAEGIETREELDTLTTLEIDYGQGFFIARPRPLPDVVRSLGQIAPTLMYAA